jgi:hypothetical protein
MIFLKLAYLVPVHAYVALPINILNLTSFQTFTILNMQRVRRRVDLSYATSHSLSYSTLPTTSN